MTTFRYWCTKDHFDVQKYVVAGFVVESSCHTIIVAVDIGEMTVMAQWVRFTLLWHRVDNCNRPVGWKVMYPLYEYWNEAFSVGFVLFLFSIDKGFAIKWLLVVLKLTDVHLCSFHFFTSYYLKGGSINPSSNFLMNTEWEIDSRDSMTININ